MDGGRGQPAVEATSFIAGHFSLQSADIKRSQNAAEERQSSQDLADDLGGGAKPIGFARPVFIGENRYDRRVTMTQDLAAAVSLFHSLADHSRLSILRRLSAGEARVRDLTDELGLAQSTVSEHVGCLRECGLVVARSEGRQNFYSVSTPEVIDVLEAAERLLAATGFKVDLCKTYGSDAR
ncbi:ArsR/SmtB family transcription factor [Microbacterium proteolyticum]|uniref:ArsR/SmtB family transcription factor n=1 Tax=Microbacterium proteolyticum TaxID=1572644 RepID=UPI0040463CA2